MRKGPVEGIVMAHCRLAHKIVSLALAVMTLIPSLALAAPREEIALPAAFHESAEDSDLAQLMDFCPAPPAARLIEHACPHSVDLFEPPASKVRGPAALAAAQAEIPAEPFWLGTHPYVKSASYRAASDIAHFLALRI